MAELGGPLYQDIINKFAIVVLIVYTTRGMTMTTLGLQLAAGLCYLIDLIKDFVVLKFIAGIFTLISG